MSKGWLGEAGTVTARRRLKDASPYDFLFPRSKGERITVKRNAGVQHTVKFIPQVVNSTLNQTEHFARFIIAPTLRQTCKAIWQWVYDHIKYEKDETGKEQVRAPVRLVSDRKGDCDCFTTFIDSVLMNVRKISGWNFEIVNRITKYDGADNFQHIYPFIKTPQGEKIILDCVTEYFDYEEPYTGKEDHLVMDLEYLNGIDSYDLLNHDRMLYEIKTSESSPQDYAAQLGRLQLFKRKNKDDGKSQEQEQKKNGGIKKAVHAVNRANPATLLLRNGLLASMKLNIMNVAGRLKWTYLNADQAKAKGLNMERFAKLRRIRERLDKMYYSAGGDPENLRKAILTGKGNKGKEVSGFGVIPIYAMSENGMTLKQIIGEDIFERENSALSGLGEPVTAATIAAATAAVATLAELIKQVGPVKDGGENSDDPEKGGEEISQDANSTTEDQNSSDSGKKSNAKTSEPVKFMDDPIGWAKKNPGTATVATVGIVAVLYGGYKIYQANNSPVEGLPLKKKKAKHQKREKVFHVELE